MRVGIDRFQFRFWAWAIPIPIPIPAENLLVDSIPIPPKWKKCQFRFQFRFRNRNRPISAQYTLYIVLNDQVGPQTACFQNWAFPTSGASCPGKGTKARPVEAAAGTASWARTQWALTAALPLKRIANLETPLDWPTL